MASLVVTSGPLEGQRIEVVEQLTIGREDADVEIEDAEISRVHARVRSTGGGLEVEDLGSTNGTFVNGERIQGTVSVGDGDVIRLGETTLRASQPAAATRVSDKPPTAAVESRATEVRDRPAPVRDRGSRASQPGQARPDFGTFRATSRRRRRAVASRLWVPTMMTYLAIGGTAAALILYFAGRG
jgi:FHA domain